MNKFFIQYSKQSCSYGISYHTPNNLEFKTTRNFVLNYFEQELNVDEAIKELLKKNLNKNNKKYISFAKQDDAERLADMLNSMQVVKKLIGSEPPTTLKSGGF